MAGVQGIECPRCRGHRSRVKHTRGGDGMTYRRRKCEACGYAFTSYELAIEEGDRYLVERDSRAAPRVRRVALDEVLRIV